MSLFNTKKLRFLAIFVAISAFSMITVNNVHAAYNYTDSDGVVWTVKEVDGDTYIGIDTVPAGLTTITVPSIADVASAADTYFLDSLCTSNQDNCASVRTATAGVTTLDMTNASKIQIKNVSRMFDTNHEVELVFGASNSEPGIVIADPADLTIADADYYSDSGNRPTVNPYDAYDGAFEGMSIKITNANNIKYFGWNAFKDTTLNSDSRAITIGSNQTVGGYVFAGSNISSLDLDAAEIGQGFAVDCTDLTSLTLGNNVDKIYLSAFEGTSALAQAFRSNNITEIGGRAFKGSGITGVTFDADLQTIGFQAFMNTNLGSVVLGDGVEIVEEGAFTNAHLSSVDLKNVENIGSIAFSNNSLTEVTLPRSITTLNNTVGIFNDNDLKKLTVAMDLTQAGLNIKYNSFASKIGFISRWGGNPTYMAQTTDPTRTIEELVLIAPYGANDEIPAGRDVPEYYDTILGDIVASSKNIIMPAAFLNFDKLKKITIGEGYEVICPSAFMVDNWLDSTTDQMAELNLPSTLKAIGTWAFGGLIRHGDVTLDTLPANLEYIGDGAFSHDRGLTLNTFDLPKLKYVGNNAFYLATVNNIAFRDGLLQSPGVRSFTGGQGNIQSVIVDTPVTVSFGNVFCYKAALGGSGRDCSDNQYASMAQYPEVDYHTVSYMINNGYGLANDLHYFESITFTNKATANYFYSVDDGDPSGGTSDLFAIHAGTIDASATSWTTVNNMKFANIGKLILPSTLTTIGDKAFYGAVIGQGEGNELAIPNTVTSIGEVAFANASANISALTGSITTIGRGAFLNNNGTIGVMDLPNLAYLGTDSFKGARITDLALRDGLTDLGINVFYGVRGLRNVTIDVDLYSNSINRLPVYSDVNAGNYGAHKKDNRTNAENYAADFYDSFVATFGNKGTFGTITFTAKAGEPCGGFANCTFDRSVADAADVDNRAYFYGIKADKIDLSATHWTSTGESMFQEAEVDEIILPRTLQTIARNTFFDAQLGDVILPTTLKTIATEAFEYATANVSVFPEGLTTIDTAAFCGSDVTDNLVIPSTVTRLGQDAFNACSSPTMENDVHYDTVTIKPDLNISQTDGQLIFQNFTGVDLDKLRIESSELPATNINMDDYDTTMPEFHGMNMDEVVITNLPKISDGAFEDCINLKKVDMSSDAALRTIGEEAFIRDTKFDDISFSSSIKNETVTIGQNAFNSTAFTSIGDSSKDFDLTAAKFDASDGYAFASMPKLKTVDVPRSFSSATVPEATFYNDGELKSATIDYKITLIDNAAFSEDNKLESIFIWGNTEILDNNIHDNDAANVGDGGRGAGSEEEYGPTIPEPTDIYAYSVSPAEEYAGHESRENYEGVFYPLDEVLYLTSNKPVVLLNEEETDFDKSNLVVYAMRRDGIILESDTWSVFDGNAYPRATSDLYFESMSAGIQADPTFGSIHDTPVPLNELDLANENFANIDFALIPDETDDTIRKVTLLYTDKYTEHLADTDILPYQEGEIPPTPETGFAKAMKGFANTTLPVVAIAVLSLLGGAVIYKKRRN